MTGSWKQSLKNLLLVAVSLVLGIIAVEGFSRIFSGNGSSDQTLNVTDRAAESEFSDAPEK